MNTLSQFPDGLSVMRNRCGMVGALLLSFLCMWLGTASATSVREASVAEMADNSAAIFEGVVVDVRARKSGRGSIVTAITFEVLDVIKGSLPERRLTLEFLGGEIQGERQSVAAMNYPQLGEQGIYFAEAIDRSLINPLYGWDQGRFLVRKDATGVERVVTADKRPVMDIKRSDSVFFDAPGSAATLSTGVARGVLAQPAAVADPGLSTGQFKQRIRNLLGVAP